LEHQHTFKTFANVEYINTTSSYYFTHLWPSLCDFSCLGVFRLAVFRVFGVFMTENTA